ncbi:MAG: hypothetical protein JO093_01270 [Acidobacteria bacterium]|nr:hypothetical protein [Acidobacteriota bacterium]MBV9068991.1 hypothetical protein [Acidobacteriota bacterium]MBV9184213.1 hypothetical protein [Acidobacteriota bacterium]
MGIVVGLMPRAETARIERGEPEGHGRAMKKTGGSDEGSGSGTENAHPESPVQIPDETKTAPATRTSEETSPLGIVREETLPIAGVVERQYVGTFARAPRVPMFGMPPEKDANEEGSEETSADSRGELLETE